MSRTNPHKLPRRFANQTQLVFGEGPEDKVWLRHLRSLYAKNTNMYSSVDCGSGGSPKVIVEAAIRRANGEKTIVIVDGDRLRLKKEYQDMQEVRRAAAHVRVIVVEPCTEALLLAILNDGQYPNKTSQQCKSEFEKIMDERKRRQQAAYAKLFDKKLLDSMRTKIKELDELIKVFTNG